VEKYTRNLIWSFLTDDRPGSIYGLTMAWPGRIDGQVIVLSLESLRLLIEGDITLAERCLTQMATSVTVRPGPTLLLFLLLSPFPPFLIFCFHRHELKTDYTSRYCTN
jgi:hypothetical protein